MGAPARRALLMVAVLAFLSLEGHLSGVAQAKQASSNWEGLNVATGTVEELQVDDEFEDVKVPKIRKGPWYSGFVYLLLLVVLGPTMLLVCITITLLVLCPFMAMANALEKVFAKYNLHYLYTGFPVWHMISSILTENLIVSTNAKYKPGSEWHKHGPNRARLYLLKLLAVLIVGAGVYATVLHVVDFVNWETNGGCKKQDCRMGALGKMFFYTMIDLMNSAVRGDEKKQEPLGATENHLYKILFVIQIVYTVRYYGNAKFLWFRQKQWREIGTCSDLFGWCPGFLDYKGVWGTICVLLLLTSYMGATFAMICIMCGLLTCFVLLPERRVVGALSFAAWSSLTACSMIQILVSESLHGPHHLWKSGDDHAFAVARIRHLMNAEYEGSRVAEDIRSLIHVLVAVFSSICLGMIILPSLNFYFGYTEPPTENMETLGLSRLAYQMTAGVYFDDLMVVSNDTDVNLRECNVSSDLVDESAESPNERYTKLIDVSQIKVPGSAQQEVFGQVGSADSDDHSVEFFEYFRRSLYRSTYNSTLESTIRYGRNNSAPHCPDLDQRSGQYLKRLQTFFNATTDADAAVYVLYDNSSGVVERKHVGLVFRGTESGGDWMASIGLSMGAHPDFCDNNVRIHSGVLTQYMSLREQIYDYFRKHSDLLKKTDGGAEAVESFIVTGHSLGGGISTASVLDMYCSPPFVDIPDNLIKHIKFSSFRVVYDRQNYTETIPLANRVHIVGMYEWPIPTSDLATHVPPTFFGYPTIDDDVHYVPVSKPRGQGVMYMHMVGLDSAMLETDCEERDSVFGVKDSPYKYPNDQFKREINWQQETADKYNKKTGKTHDFVRPELQWPVVKQIYTDPEPGKIWESTRSTEATNIFLILASVLLAMAMFPEFDVWDEMGAVYDAADMVTQGGLLKARGSNFLTFLNIGLAAYNAFVTTMPSETGLHLYIVTFVNGMVTVPLFMRRVIPNYPMIIEQLTGQKGFQLVLHSAFTIMFHFYSGMLYLSLFMGVGLISPATYNFRGGAKQCGCVRRRHSWLFNKGYCLPYGSKVDSVPSDEDFLEIRSWKSAPGNRNI